MDSYTPCQKVYHIDAVADFLGFIGPNLVPFKGIQKFRAFNIKKVDGIPQIFVKVDTLLETPYIGSNRLGGIF
jgi:hypothetical protein